MVSFTLAVASTLSKPLASVKTRKVTSMASKVKSTFSKLATNHKAGIVHSPARRLLRRSHKEKRAPRKSLPSTLGPLPEDLCIPLLKQVEDELERLHADAGKESDTRSSSDDSKSTLVSSEESKFSPFDKTVDCEAIVIPDLVYSRESFSASELALFEIKLVSQVATPEEDYYAGESLVPIAGYDVPL